MASPVVPPPPLLDIHDDQGNRLGALPISEQDKAQLAATGKITLTFHTPRMLRETLGPRNFTLNLTQDANGNIKGDQAQLGRAIDHLTEIASAQALRVVVDKG